MTSSYLSGSHFWYGLVRSGRSRLLIFFLFFLVLRLAVPCCMSWRFEQECLDGIVCDIPVSMNWFTSSSLLILGSSSPLQQV